MDIQMGQVLRGRSYWCLECKRVYKRPVVFDGRPFGDRRRRVCPYKDCGALFRTCGLRWELVRIIVMESLPLHPVVGEVYAADLGLVALAGGDDGVSRFSRVR